MIKLDSFAARLHLEADPVSFHWLISSNWIGTATLFLYAAAFVNLYALPTEP